MDSIKYYTKFYFDNSKGVRSNQIGACLNLGGLPAVLSLGTFLCACKCTVAKCDKLAFFTAGKAQM